MKRVVKVLFESCVLAQVALADGASTVVAALSPKQGETNPLYDKMQKAEEAKLDEIALRTNKGPEMAKDKAQASDTRKEVLNLLDEVEKLKTKVVVTKRATLATQNPRQKKKIGAKTYYTFKDGDIFEVHSGVDTVTDIELQGGEKLTSAPVAGDTVRWKMSLLTSGEGSTEATHLILKPLEENIETNIIISTDRRVYHLRALASDWYMPAIAWSYPEDDAKAFQASLKKKETVEGLSLSPESLNFGYHLKGKNFAWTPIRVFDDGKKTYIQMRSEIASVEAPALFILEEEGEPQLVNYRVKGSYYIVDRLFTRAQLRIGAKLKVDILSDSYKPTLWEVIF